MKKLIVILLIVVSVGGCKKNEESLPDDVIGKWEWVKTIIPFVGQETNPQTAGFSMTLEFSNNGTVNEYRNGLLIGTSSYDIKGNVLSSSVITSHFYFENGTLIFSEAYLDGPAHYYSRIK